MRDIRQTVRKIQTVNAATGVEHIIAYGLKPRFRTDDYIDEIKATLESTILDSYDILGNFDTIQSPAIAETIRACLKTNVNNK